MKKTINVLGVNVSVTNIPQATRSILDQVKGNQKGYVCVAPVATIMDAQDDAQYKEIVNRAAMTVPDGMPLVWLGRLAGTQMQRTYGPDLMLSVCDQGRGAGMKHFFYGGTDAVNQKLIVRLTERYPDIRIAGSFAPGVLRVKEVEKQEIIDKINAARPDVLWVGLGSPKQDFWMAAHRSLLDVPVMVGVGAAFDFIAGTKPQAPMWMRRVGLEWFFRLCCEPRRLWRRYLVGNTRFMFLILCDAFKKIFRRAA